MKKNILPNINFHKKHSSNSFPFYLLTKSIMVKRGTGYFKVISKDESLVTCENTEGLSFFNNTYNLMFSVPSISTWLTFDEFLEYKHNTGDLL